MIRNQRCVVKVAGRIMAKENISLHVFPRMHCKSGTLHGCRRITSYPSETKVALSVSLSVLRIVRHFKQQSLPARLSLQLCCNSMVADALNQPEGIALSFALQHYVRSPIPLIRRTQPHGPGTRNAAAQEVEQVPKAALHDATAGGAVAAIIVLNTAPAAP